MATLFSQRQLSEFLRLRSLEMLAEVNDYSEEQILNISINDLCDYCEKQYSVEPLIVKTSEMQAQHAETDFQFQPQPGRMPAVAKGTLVGVDVPFEGDQRLLYHCPSTADSMPPEAEILPHDEASGTLRFLYRMLPQEDPTAIRGRIDQQLRQLELWTTNVNRDIESFNASIHATVLKRVEERRQRLLAARRQVAALGIPLARRPEAKKTYTVAPVRRKIVPLRPVAAEAPYIPDPVLSSAEYETILNMMSLMTRVMECSPNAFRTLHEEDLRTHFLVQLNAQYEGRATGETFNLLGKTDIHIPYADASVTGSLFIAECKFWHGPEQFREAIDQLLDYVTWRDTKTAILIFNKNKDLSSVLSSVTEVVEQHPNYKRTEGSRGETGFRFVLCRSDDKNREFILTVLVFDVPTADETSPR